MGPRKTHCVSSEIRQDEEECAAGGAAGPVTGEATVWLEGAAAVLDAAGWVQEISASLRDWLGVGSAADLTGRSLWTLLAERCPGWQASLEALRAGSAPFESVELTLDGGRQGGPEARFRLDLARGAGACFVRLESVLPPPAELAEAGWSAALGERGAGRQMFVRLLRAEAQLAKLAEHWPGVIFSQRPDFSFQFVGGRIEELTGLGVDEWQRPPARFWEVVHDADVPELEHQLRWAARTGQSTSLTFRVRHRRTGRVSYVMEHRQPVLSGSGLLLGYEGVWLDVTRQTLAEKLLTSAAWKETLAILTMGLAHDFSNVMAGIHSLSESFLDELEASHPFREGLGLIQRSSLQASQLVHRIVHLHLGKPGERNYHDLNQIVGELLELVRKVIPRRIEVTAEIAPEALPVYVDAFEFRQVIINLALNAADAMPERGRLVLRTRRLTAPPEGTRFVGLAVKYPCACLTVQDNGSGIKPAHLEIIFDPFFTTKAGGKGSGLGLYNARLFASKHRGAILAESEEGAGASFHVCLPEADFTEADPSSGGGEVSGTRRSLLLYGSSARLLAGLAELFRTEGYHVAVAESLEQVAGRLTAKDYHYDGLVAVVESSGLVLAPHIESWRRLQPQLRVILRPVGCHRDELEPELLRGADLVVTPELSPPALLERLRGILNR